ncbi:XdhC family protein [Nocardioides bruguierae]|uniref:XdhC family protein n=1 Tax=Nocardioides bruguierae TaxID=2945102 RepID=A0A9X2IFS7_9ACTN|nr:XdhC/CoxI family protein [Nocardioides bruguierae]MCM0620829.1 XdhC family protein [Nocardioides bruguierae]
MPTLDPALAALREAFARGEAVGLATVVRTFSSAPRPVGARLVLTPGADPADDTVTGSVSGGCVEAAVYHLAHEALAGAGPRVQRYGVSDDDAFAVGLTCGGTIDVLVEAVSPGTAPELAHLLAQVAAERPAALAVVVEHPDPGLVGRRLVVSEAGVHGSLGLGARADAAVADDVRGALAAGRGGTLGYGPAAERLGEGMTVLVDVHAAPPRLLVYGAIDLADALAEAGSFLGFRVTVTDARPLFATTARFPHADEVVRAQPHEHLAAEAAAGRVDPRTVVVVLTHDPRFDVPLLAVALRLPDHVRPAFVGVMGSRRTHADRLARLHEAGLSSTETALLSSPVGLDLGGRTPAETALSVLGEVVATRHGASGRPLGETTGALHRPDAPLPVPSRQ